MFGTSRTDFVIFVCIFSMQEFLGCTSFGLRHLKKAEKDVNGWYHLLTEDVGRKKHLQMTTRHRQAAKHTGKDCMLYITFLALLFVCHTADALG